MGDEGRVAPSVQLAAAIGSMTVYRNPSKFTITWSDLTSTLYLTANNFMQNER